MEKTLDFEYNFCKYIFNREEKTLTYTVVDKVTFIATCRLEYKYNDTDNNIELIDCCGQYADNFGKLETPDGKLFEIDSYLNNFGESDKSLREYLMTLINTIEG